jgi:hypothetical protein
VVMTLNFLREEQSCSACVGQPPDAISPALDRAEPEVEKLMRRANAWARGDIAALREASSDTLPPESCMTQLQRALENGEMETPAQAKQMIDEMMRQEKEIRRDVEAHWLFSLRDLGYEVESPR